MPTIDIDAQMAWAESQVGFVEGANNANPYGPWQGVSNSAYCDSFSQMAAVEYGGYRWPANCQFGYKGAAYCPYTEADSRNLGLWRDAGGYRQPKRGDQILFDWTHWGGCDHIGTVWGTDDGYNTVWTVEANTGSPNGVHWVRRDWTYIRGFVALSEVAAGPAPASGPRTLKKGFVGEDVRGLQKALIALGYDLGRFGADGDFGQLTDNAVRAFQRDQHLDVDGEVGPLTWAALDKGNQEARPAPLPVARQVSYASMVNGRMLDNAAGSVNTWESHGEANQRWGIGDVGDGSVVLVSMSDGQVLDVAGNSTDDGGAVITWPWNGGANQKWVVENVTERLFRIRNVGSGKYLDVTGSGQGNGTVVQQYSRNDTAAQTWLEVNITPEPDRAWA